MMKRTISIIGAGRVGRALGRALRRRGWKIRAVVTQSARTARAAVRAIGGGTARTSIQQDVCKADVILIATPDSEIKNVAYRIVASAGAALRSRALPGRHASALSGKIVLHCSGVHSGDALAPLQGLGAFVAAMHPMQTFGREGAPKLHGVIFGIDGDARAVRVASQIAHSLGGIPIVIHAGSKPAYHCAGGFASQNVLVMMEAGVQMLLRIGFTRRQATKALMNLAQQTLRNIESAGPKAAWTGPVPRGDFETVGKHVQELQKYPREFRQAYQVVTNLGVQMLAAKPGKTRRRLANIWKRKD